MVLALTGQRSRSVSAFYTNDYYACVNAHLNDNNNMPWVYFIVNFLCK